MTAPDRVSSSRPASPGYPAHRAAPGTSALLRAERAGGLLGGRVRTAEDGSFVLPALLPGRHDLHALLASDEPPRWSSSMDVRVLGPLLARRELAG